MFKTVLIANRGEIALRVARTCRELGIRTVVTHSTADRDSTPVRYADAAVQIGPAPSRHSYNNAAAIVSAAQVHGCDAVHPGYGFLSEDPYFAEICAAEGLTFIGPPAEVISLLGDKLRARRFVAELGLPVLPSSDPEQQGGTELARVADRIGYPVIIKASAGGGGRGMAIVRDPRDFPRAYAETRSAAQNLFGDARVYVEKYLDAARHIEIQILADGHGNAVYLGGRDCSVQRRRQKLVEESPPPSVRAADLDRIGQLSAKVAREAGYVGAGTFEFVADEDDEFYFLEVNSRLQVEHPVTEMVTGLDLVREQLLVAAGGTLSFRQQDVEIRGASIECRINAEDPARGFLPTPGLIDELVLPGGPFVRVDTHAVSGARVTADYDSLLAKVIVWAPDRAQAIARMDRALGELTVSSHAVRTTTGFLREVLARPEFREARHTTALVDTMREG
ncbi:acetyl-CoA carboxylase biotin carboxylase subunit [Actinomadura rupiterrae]|uniref:acetyl-CoA carboxylase biotin carboxylase subunit n=1 Tax=Actinomadura rupiterrae TaxID=559627 RepID=UPI0020A44952|nr:biotin carboxylase N-terminal domain-containing protein [Actinomadura rupiterrae]MCP2341076.1 acetyl-CoA carboxylase biotin carboxylase subunit [Actinomadura rupiterrae]